MAQQKFLQGRDQKGWPTRLKNEFKCEVLQPPSPSGNTGSEVTGMGLIERLE